MGARAQAEGLGFEKLFTVICNQQGFQWIKIPTGARVYGKDRFGKPKYALTRSPFDFAIAGILNGQSVAAYIDCKTIDANTYPRSLIDWNQVNDLERFERVGHPAGYLIYFRKSHQVVFFKASKILGMESSLRVEQGICLGDVHSVNLSLLWS